MKHPIVALWSHPRSMSTATERIMHERGDMRVFHEPFLHYYYEHHSPHAMPMLEDDGAHPKEYDAVRDQIVEAALKQPVFFKDMGYYITEPLCADREFALRVHHAFLIRDPRRSIASYYKLDPEMTSTEIGLEAQWLLFSFLRNELGMNPMVIEAEAVADNPEKIIGNLWKYTGLPFVSSAFEWDTDKTPEAWSYVEGWHGKAMASGGIRKDTSDPDAVFEAAAEKAPHLRDYLAHHQVFYEKLKAQA